MELRSPWLPHQQPVVAVTRHHEAGAVITPHAHARAQLVFADYGTMTLTTPGRRWIIGPREGLWIPPMVEHAIRVGDGPLLHCTIYVTAARPTGPAAACAVQMSDFLRHLVLEFTSRDMHYDQRDSTGNLARVLLDELADLDVVQIDLATGQDDRLMKVTEALLEEPQSELTLDDWGRRVGASSKTLERLFRQETGLTFKQWRQRVRVVRSIEVLNAGLSVGNAAHHVGYSNVSSYISAFKAVFGITPARYTRAPTGGNGKLEG